MSPAIVLASNSDEDTSSDDNEEQAPIVPPKGKHLWCQDDSYGYTKGGDCFLAVSLSLTNVCFRENFKRNEGEL